MVDLFNFLAGYGLGAFVTGYVAGCILHAGYRSISAIFSSGD